MIVLVTMSLLIACAAQVQSATTPAPSPAAAPAPQRPLAFGQCDGLVESESWTEAARACSSFLEQAVNGAPQAYRMRAHVGLGVALWHRGGAEKADASQHFERAVTLADEGRPVGEALNARLARYRAMLDGGSNEELAKLVDAVAKARFFLGEEVFERFESLEFPGFQVERQLPPDVRVWVRHTKGADAFREWQQMLRFLPRDDRQKQIGSMQFQFWAKQRFGPWLNEATKIVSEATKRYTAAVEEDVPEWEMASAARLGTMHLALAKSLETAPIDPSVEGDAELEAIYRDALGERARVFGAQAVAAFEHCLEVGRESSVENQWSRQCAEDIVAAKRSASQTTGSSVGPVPDAGPGEDSASP